MKINAKTRLISLFGWPVEHSLSPAMHNAAFAQMGLNYSYMALPVAPELLGDAVHAIKAFNMPGVNVTVPHKENVIQYLDDIDAEARDIGAVNTIVNNGGKLKGYNTDGRGFMKSLKEAGIETKGKNILVIGAGGASKAISYYLSKDASKFFLFDIDKPKAESFLKYLVDTGRTVHVPDSLNAAKGMDIIINATPLGLKESDPLAIPEELIAPPVVIIDLIYHETPLLRAAKKKGCKTLDGLGMLLWQGVLASELWTGKMPPHELMRAALLDGMRSK
ncbi:MAG: shikimate dehydrogenase [Actinomycetota bacterium]|nr:shikimate dehydrogenase [Actinomycetota bacterium]